MIRIIVDSTCDLPGDLLSKYRIITVPMMISLSGVEYRDKIDIHPRDVFEAMDNGIAAKTSQIDLDFLSNAFEKCCAERSDFIYIAFSSAMSCTCHSARVIIEEFAAMYPDINMSVIDSMGGSMSTGLVAMQAAKLIEAGASFQSVSSCIREMISHTEHIFTIMDLKWLIKGGRLDAVSGTIGSLLGVKPIVYVKNGSMSILKKVRGMDNAISVLAETVIDRVRDFPEQIIGIAHTGKNAPVARLHDKLAGTLHSASFLFSELGSALSSHIGSGALGVFFFNKRFKFYRS